MAEKKIRKEGYDTIRTLLGSGNFLKSFHRRANIKIFNRLTWNISLSKKNAGFTLVELVIVIALISIFIAGAIAVLDPLSQIQKANDARRKSDLTQVQKALEAYYDDFQNYPAHSGNYEITYGGNPVLWGNPFGPGGLYMQKLPSDKSGRNYIYCSTDQAYYLYASLERKNKDPNVCNPDGNLTTDDKCTNAPVSTPCPTDASCGTGLFCNYGVSSSNVSP